MEEKVMVLEAGKRGYLFESKTEAAGEAFLAAIVFVLCEMGKEAHDAYDPDKEFQLDFLELVGSKKQISRLIRLWKKQDMHFLVLPRLDTEEKTFLMFYGDGGIQSARNILKDSRKFRKEKFPEVKVSLAGNYLKTGFRNEKATKELEKLTSEALRRILRRKK